MNEARGVKNLLTKAAKLLQTKGWCQFTSKNNRGQFCAAGALHHAGNMSLLPTIVIARVLLQDAIRLRHYHETHLTAWNDQKGRTKAQVLQVFRTAIKLAGLAAEA